jgi:hypothetical protein
MPPPSIVNRQRTHNCIPPPPGIQGARHRKWVSRRLSPALPDGDRPRNLPSRTDSDRVPTGRGDPSAACARVAQPCDLRPPAQRLRTVRSPTRQKRKKETASHRATRYRRRFRGGAGNGEIPPARDQGSKRVSLVRDVWGPIGPARPETAEWRAVFRGGGKWLRASVLRDRSARGAVGSRDVWAHGRPISAVLVGIVLGEDERLKRAAKRLPHVRALSPAQRGPTGQNDAPKCKARLTLAF